MRRTLRTATAALVTGLGALAVSSPAVAAPPVLEQMTPPDPGQQGQDGILIELLRAVGDLLQQLLDVLL